ncbi:MAG: hypothetical protein K0U93_27575 [Gammaproteobacteria bacterium]|nr:hypothetical protein [Gammaproteobacteria bacterium]
MDAGTDDGSTYQTAGEDPDKVSLFNKLDAIPTPGGNLNHAYQGKELYFELFRYLTGQGIYNAHLGYQDFGDGNRNTNLDKDFPLHYWDPSIEDSTNKSSLNPDGTYISPLASLQCSKIFVINLMFQVSNQEDDSDAAIVASRANGGMAGINLSGKNNNFDSVIRYMRDADLSNGTYGTSGNLDGLQNVVSYFLVDPTKINNTTNGYANAGGTGTALPLSDNPDDLTNTINNIFSSILSVSTTFVAPSVPVNVFNRAQIVNEVFLALFEAEENGFPRWDGNLKKVIIADNANGDREVQDARGASAIDIDGRLKRDALTFWTDAGGLPTPVDDQVAGADGRAVARGGAGQKVPGFLSGSPGLTNGVPGGRTVYFDDAATSGGLAPFNADSTTATALWSELTSEWSTAPSGTDYLSSSSTERQHAENILKFARGLKDDGSTTREWLLGDPLHSRPRPVNYGARATGFSNTNPDIRILMATNDGALRMFRNTDSSGTQSGAEVWSFVPRAIVGKLDRLRSQTAGTPIHPITVDGSVVEYTIDNNSDGNLKTADGDRAYAFFGLRRGGKSYYALDISDPDAPKLLWTISKGAIGTDFAELAQSWSTPEVVKLKVNGADVVALVIGGGYNGDDDGDDLGDLGKDAKNRATRANSMPSPGVDDDEGNAVFIVNALTGQLIWKFTKGASAGFASFSKTYFHPDAADAIPARVTAVSTNGDAYADRLYFGDTGGTVWRADLAGMKDHDSNPSTPDIRVIDDISAWTVTKLFETGRHVSGNTSILDDRRFFNRPDVILSRDNIGPFDGVLIGTGDREDPLGTNVRNAFYLIKDRAITSGLPNSTTLTEGDLADLTSNCLQSSNCSTTPDISNGWRIDFANTGEKNLAAAITAGGAVFFTTFAPTPATSSCGLSEGQGRLYVVSAQDATAVYNFDSTNDVNGTTKERVDLLGSGGIPVEVVPLDEGHVLIQGQEAGQNIVKAPGRTSYKTYWHERNE